MGERKENVESALSTALARFRKLFAEELLKTPLLTPVPVYSIQEQQHHRFPAPQESFWQICIAWVRYHTIQLQWDIERTVARLLHRRWGG
jgi:hypothetical protein